MKTNNLKPKEDIYAIINKLICKTLPESKNKTLIHTRIFSQEEEYIRL